MKSFVSDQRMSWRRRLRGWPQPNDWWELRGQPVNAPRVRVPVPIVRTDKGD